jgi:glycosyltransferase involved in cell wall biosynthesis
MQEGLCLGRTAFAEYWAGKFTLCYFFAANRRGMNRRPRLAVLLLPSLDHFMLDIIARLPAASGWDVRGFLLHAGQPDALLQALAWADDPARDALWFEFCWPPFPALIAATDFAGRRIIMRVHRIEAFETDHAARAPWPKISDVIVVSDDMAKRLRDIAPSLERSTRLHVIHNGVDIERFAPDPAIPPEPFRLGWCGNFILRKNPTLALQILAALHRTEPRWRLAMAAGPGDPVAFASFSHLAARLGVSMAIDWEGAVPQRDIHLWHRRNILLLSTSIHESFGYAIAEAGACGCDLAILDHPGAARFWPQELLFGTVEEAVAIIKEAQPGRWQALIRDTLSLGRQINAIAGMLNHGAAP